MIRYILRYRGVQRRKLNEDTKLRNQYCGPYFIEKFTSPTNVTLQNKSGKELPRSALINNLKKCQIRKQFKILENNMSEESDSPNPSSRDSGTDDEYVHSSDDVVSADFSDNEDDKSFNYDECSNSSSSNTHGSDIAVDGVDHKQQYSVDGGEMSSDKDHTPVEMSDLSISSDTDSVIDYPRNTNMIPCEIYTDDSDKMQTKHEQSETKELYEPIHKVLRKRITPNGNVQYYVVWKNHRAKKYNTWINESDLTETLKNKLKNRKFNNKHRLQTLCTRTNPSMEKKVINNQNDWLSFYHIIEVPIIKTFVHNGITYEYKCDSIESMYTFLKHTIMKNTQ